MVNVTKTYLPNLDKYKQYIDGIFQSGWMTNHGELVQELERRLREYLGVKNILLVTNGTLALQVAYKVLDLRGEVITTPFSFAATTSSLVWEGLTPVFADINPETFNLDWTRLEQAITPKTSGIVPVHVFGNACDVEEIDRIAALYGVKVIYDAAHAFAVRYKGNSILNYGDISVLSFHATKIFHTIEGGALIFRDDLLYERAKLMINFGIAGPENILDLGINAKMNEFQAAMGLCVLDEIDGILRGRKMIYESYAREFRRIDGLQMQKQNENASMNYSYFPLIFPTEEALLRSKHVMEENNIIPRRYFYPSLDELPYITADNVEVSRSISKRILCLPIYDTLDREDQKRIVGIIRDSFHSC